jgi:WD40 repeat protein
MMPVCTDVCECTSFCRNRTSTGRKWNALTGAELLTLRSEFGEVSDLAFSADGRQLAIASGNHTVVWDSVSGQQLLTLPTHLEWVSRVAFSADGKRLVTAAGQSIDNETFGTVEGYDLDAHELLNLAHKYISRNTSNLTAQEYQLYFQSETCPPLP